MLRGARGEIDPVEANPSDRWASWARQELPISPGWLLRPLVADDIPAVVSTVDTHVRRGLMMDRPFGHTEGARIVLDTSIQLAARGRGAIWGITRIDDEASSQGATHPTSVVKGVLSLHAVDGNEARVGFWLGPQARGRGAAAAAVRAIAEKATSVNDQHDPLAGLTWVSPVGNVDSLRVIRAAGFRTVGSITSPVGSDGSLHRSWYAEWTPGNLSADRTWADCLVEIAAGAWQLQPMAADDADLAERLLPVSACVPVGVWAAKEITTARPDAIVALLQRGRRAWVLAQPTSDSPIADEAAAAAFEVVGRYARRALGLMTP